jgi:hypothetical protein
MGRADRERKVMKKKIVSIFVLMLLYISIFVVIADTINLEPSTPIIRGECESELGVRCFYTVQSSDPQGDYLYYEFRYSDSPSVKIRDGPFKSGDIITFSHCWCDLYQNYNPFVIQVMAIDEYDHESNWGRFEVNMTNVKIGNLCINNYGGNIFLKISIFQLFEKLIYRLPLLERLFNI